ncbi:MAG: GlsB/YeaQ/YmgE family stress response membrane protein [Planctomycetaceae bacterium]|nr:GlsB/YeaQ/YmgE family stress response membrane protein [Planctomycetaceae bacterium]
MITALIGWMVLGLIAGAIGRLLVPGRQPIGLLMTMLLGVAGSYVGGFVAYLFTGGDWLQPSGWILSSLGAALSLALYISWAKKGTHL